MLDDYARWLGKRPETGIADILSLTPVIAATGNRHLEVLVSEAKYIDYSALAVSKKRSEKQLVDTVKQLQRSVDPDLATLDASLILARLSAAFGQQPSVTAVLGGRGMEDGYSKRQMLNSRTRLLSHFLPWTEEPLVPKARLLEHEGSKLVDNPEIALELLERINAEMDQRYALFKKHVVDNLKNYRRKTGNKPPIRWLIFDEFGIWMQNDDYRKAIEPPINTLAKKARAAGIFLVLADQRQDNRDFPMQTRSNLGNRLALKVADKGTSNPHNSQKVLKKGKGIC